MTEKDRHPSTVATDLKSDCVKHLWLQGVQMEGLEERGGPITIARAEGVYLEDTEGRRYMDLMAGAGNVILGHSNEPVKQAIREQLDQVCYALQAAYANIPAIELAKALAEITPGDLNTCFFVCNGSDANETAIKIARQYFANRGERRFKVISRSANSYQGCHLTTLSASGTVARRVKFEPLGVGFVRVPPPYCYRCYYELTYPGCGVICARVIDRVIQDEGPETICAFIGDTHSVYGATPPQEYFTILREICDKHGILMICDEVVTGFGRTGKMFACDGRFNFIPDILTIGKGLTTGYLPLSATIISDRVREAFNGTPEEHKEFSTLYTYAGVPLACAAGVATLRELREQRLVERVARMGDMVQERLGRLEEESPFVGAARSVGLLGSLEIVKDKKTREVFEPYALKDRINGALLEEGLSTYVMAYPPILVLMPPYVISEEEMLGAIDRIEGVIDQTCRKL